MVDIRFESFGENYESRLIKPVEIAEVYHRIDPDASASFAWNDGADDDVLIVAVGSDYSQAELLRDGTFYRLKASDQNGYREIEIGGQSTEYPECFLMPREQGLEILEQAGDLDALMARYTWVE